MDTSHTACLTGKTQKEKRLKEIPSQGPLSESLKREMAEARRRAAEQSGKTF